MKHARRGDGVAQLQILGDEFHVEHAATAILDVPELVAGKLLGDAAAHVQHLGGELGGLARAREDLAQHRADALRETRRAADHAGAGQRHVLPGPGVLELIAAEAFDAGGDGALVAGGTQAHVDLEQPALAGRRGDAIDEALRQARIVVDRGERLRAVGGAAVPGLLRGFACGHVIHEDEIDIGGDGQLAAAELAEGDDGDAVAGQAAMLARELLFDRWLEGGDGGVRDVGERGAGGFGVRDVAQHAHADLELAILGPAAHDVQHVLEVVGLAQRLRQFRAQGFRRRQRVEEAARQHRLQQIGVTAQMVSQARRAAHDLRDQVEQAGIGVEQREQLHPGRQMAEELVEAGEGDIGMGGARQRFQQLRRDLRQQLAGACAAHGAVAAVMPAADHLGNGGAVGKAQAADGGDRLRVIVGAGEDEVAGPAQRRRLLEQVGIVVLDVAEVPEHRRGERLGGRKAGEAGEGVEFRPGRGQGLGLAVVHHLQAMLDLAQEAIGGDHVVGRALGHAAGIDERVDGGAGGGLAQRRVAAAPDQLLGLGEELDLADAAAAELDVVAADGDVAVALDGMDLALDRMDVLDGCEVQMLAPDERPQAAQEQLAGGDVAADGARLNHGRALPVLTHALVVGLGRDHREGERRRGRIRSQPQVGAEDIPIVGALLQDPQEIARQAHEEILQGAAAAIVDLVAVIEHDEIDVAGVVELAGAELAHGEDDEPGLARGFSGLRQVQVAGLGGPPQQMGDRGADAGVGEGAERAGDPFERPLAPDVGERDEKRGTAAGDAQGLHDPLAVALDGAGPVNLVHQFAEDSVDSMG